MYTGARRGYGGQYHRAHAHSAVYAHTHTYTHDPLPLTHTQKGTQHKPMHTQVQ